MANLFAVEKLQPKYSRLVTSIETEGYLLTLNRLQNKNAN